MRVASEMVWWLVGSGVTALPEVQPCINGRTVAIGAYVGEDVEGIVDRLLGEQLADGGWNCEAEYGSVRSSFATTICVLDGLLERGLFRGLRSGEVVDPDWLRFSFPTWWHYDVLRALDYFRATGDAPDPRLADAVAVLRSKKQPDGTWLLENTHPGAVHLVMEDGDGSPSRWNTLRARATYVRRLT